MVSFRFGRVAGSSRGVCRSCTRQILCIKIKKGAKSISCSFTLVCGETQMRRSAGFVHRIGLPMTTTTARGADAGAPLTEQAFRSLRHDVLAGTFVPGGKLKLDELQRHYGYSSSPLREALSRLAPEGLVRADERRGFRVAALSLDDLNDITHMRLMLDVEALRGSIAAGDDAWEAAIVAAFHRLEKVESRLSDGPQVLDEEWSEVHRGFHLALLAACASPPPRPWS